jgi:hypothetical protein
MVLGLVCVTATRAFAQAPAPAPAVAEGDHTAVFELGWEGDWEHAEGWHHGLNFACEITPVEHWLEVEFGASLIYTPAGTEIPIDLLFKKPWTLGKGVEFMAGVGPELVHDPGGTSWGFEVAGDFMIWPSKNVGWYVEPAYERTFQHGGAQGGLAIAAGLLIGR